MVCDMDEIELVVGVKRGRGRPAGTAKNPVGHTHSTYTRWVGMRQRCYNPKSHIWKYYGGRGITVCDRWLGKDGFRNFWADMGDSGGLTLDRVDNSKGYSPENCKWSTMEEQCKNRRPKGDLPINPKSLYGKAKLAGLPYYVVYSRIRQLGWPEKRALSEPVNEPGRKAGSKFPGR